MKKFRAVAERYCKRCNFLKLTNREGYCEQCDRETYNEAVKRMNAVRNRRGD
jgi:hypothetical protein